MNADRRARAELMLCLRGERVAADWPAVFGLANEVLLTPALYSALAASGQLSALPTDAADYLAMLHRLNAERNRSLHRQAIEIVGLFNQRGVTPALLKGGLALFAGPYADPAQRMMRDLDLLVPAERREAAVMALASLGYRPSRLYPAGHHAVGDFARPNDAGSVDLHTELIDASYLLPAAELRARATLKEVEGVGFLVPSPTDRILHNVLHAQIHFLGSFYRGELSLQQVHELAALARHFGAAIDWDFMAERLGEHRLATALESYLLAAERWFGVAWPLGRPASAWARLHYRRCELQQRVPALRQLGFPWGNVRGAFAWHRMRALYGNGHGKGGSPFHWRCRHLLHYVQSNSIGAAFRRALRPA
jgi:hypothetical protein